MQAGAGGKGSERQPGRGGETSSVCPGMKFSMTMYFVTMDSLVKLTLKLVQSIGISKALSRH